MTGDLRLRPAGPGDTDRLCSLLAACYPDNVKADPAVLRWQYWDNPYGRALSWVYEDAGELVCHWAAVPVPMVLDDRPVTGLKTADAATAPSHRGRGLFAEVGRRLFADAAERGHPAIITHPNPNAARGVEQAGAVLVARVPAYVRALDEAYLAGRFRIPLPVARAVRRVAFAAGRTHPGVIVPAPPDGLGALWAATSATVHNGIRRDEGWWQWRYARHPRGTYRYAEVREGGTLRAAAVGVQRDAFGAVFLFVLELLARDVASANGVLDALAVEFEGVAGAALIALPGTVPARLATAAGFRRLPRALEPQPLRFMVAAPGSDTPALAARPWTVSWGDLDHL